MEKLNIEIITVKDFIFFDYHKKVDYFRTFYNRTHVIFRFYFKIYKKYFELNDHINSLIKIDELEYVDNFNESSSSTDSMPPTRESISSASTPDGSLAPL